MGYLQMKPEIKGSDKFNGIKTNWKHHNTP